MKQRSMFSPSGTVRQRREEPIPAHAFKSNREFFSVQCCFVAESYSSMTIVLTGLEAYLAPRLSSNSLAAFAEFRITIGFPKMFMYITSPVRCKKLERAYG